LACALTSDSAYVVSVSDRLLSWELTEGEICREVDPQAEGIMMDMALSEDGRRVAAFTR